MNDKGQTHAGSWKLTYDKYANRFKKVIDELKLDPEHRAHDPRKTFITRCKKDITESTYTVSDMEWLRKDLEKMQ